MLVAAPLMSTVLSALAIATGPASVEDPEARRAEPVATEPGVPEVVRWTAPPQCPAEPQVRAAVERYVGRSVGHETVTAVATVDGDAAAGFRLQLVVTHGGDSDARLLRDAKCELLADAAAVMVAMAIDPSATARVMATEPPPVEPAPAPQPTIPNVEAATTPESPLEPVSETPRRVSEPPPGPRNNNAADEARRQRCGPGPSLLRDESRSFRPDCFAVGVGLPLQLGPLPRFGPGLSGNAALLWPRVRLELGGAFFFQQAKRLDDGRGVDVRLGVGHARACARLAARRVEFPLCTGLEAGAMFGEGVGFIPSRPDRIPWLGALADAGATWSPRAWIALGAQAGAVIPLARYRLRAADLTVHQAESVGLRLSMRVEARFP